MQRTRGSLADGNTVHADTVHADTVHANSFMRDGSELTANSPIVIQRDMTSANPPSIADIVGSMAINQLAFVIRKQADSESSAWPSTVRHVDRIFKVSETIYYYNADSTGELVGFAL